MKTYKIQDREAGNVIEFGLTLNEAEKKVKDFEKADKKEGSFTLEFYEIKAEENDEKIKRFFTQNDVVNKVVSISKIEEMAEIPKQSLYNFVRGKKYCYLTDDNIQKLIPILEQIGY